MKNILRNMKKLSKISESIWSDMQDRSTGKNLRKEDDDSNKDIFDVESYLKTIYESIELAGSRTPSYEILVSKNDEIQVPISICMKTRFFSSPVISPYWAGTCADISIGGFGTSRGLTITLTKSSAKNLPKSVFNGLTKTYDVVSKKGDDEKYFEVWPKDGYPVTVDFFIEVIDYLLDNINKEEDYFTVIRKK